MCFKGIIFVGCGNMGSLLAYTTFMKNNENKKFGEFILIDNDSIEEKNLPYVFFTKQNIDVFLHNPKIYALSEILNQNNLHNIKIKQFYSTYSKEKYINTFEDYFKIDCRDNSDIDNWFNIKINIDGLFSIVNILDKNIKDVKNEKKERYRFSNSYFNTLFVSNIITNMIFNFENYQTGTYIIDLRKEFTTKIGD